MKCVTSNGILTLNAHESLLSLSSHRMLTLWGGQVWPGLKSVRFWSCHWQWNMNHSCCHIVMAFCLLLCHWFLTSTFEARTCLFWGKKQEKWKKKGNIAFFLFLQVFKLRNLIHDWILSWACDSNVLTSHDISMIWLQRHSAGLQDRLVSHFVAHGVITVSVFCDGLTVLSFDNEKRLSDFMADCKCSFSNKNLIFIFIVVLIQRTWEKLKV